MFLFGLYFWREISACYSDILLEAEAEAEGIVNLSTINSYTVFIMAANKSMFCLCANHLS